MSIINISDIFRSRSLRVKIKSPYWCFFNWKNKTPQAFLMCLDRMLERGPYPYLFQQASHPAP